MTSYRYPGSRPFKDNDFDRLLFFGRENEKQILLHSVLAENLFVLFAKSGIGKTSLLNAGLMEFFRKKDFIPLKIRFNNPYRTPLKTVYMRIGGGIKQRNKEVNEHNRIDYEEGVKNSLWEYFKTTSFWVSENKRLTPILILDQFEEFFTMHSQKNREAFISQLADLIRGRVPSKLRDSYKANEHFPYSETAPKVKIIISIREDYLGHLEEMAPEIPTILQNRFRLLPLKRRQAKVAIEKPASLPKDDRIKTKGFTYDPKTVDAMLSFLGKSEERDEIIQTDEIEPFQLQLLCRHIEERVNKKSYKNSSEYIVQESELDGEEGMQKVLQGFYDSQIKALGSIEKIRARKLCEKGLIGARGRLTLEEDEIKNKFKVPKNLLFDLVNNRLLRAEPRGRRVFYELTHDNLIKPIKKSERERKVKKIKIGLAAFVVILIIISILIQMLI
jgi:hypothetical protein